MPPDVGRGNGWLTGAGCDAVEPSEGDLIEGLCVPSFRRLATFAPDGVVRHGSRHAWDDPTEQDRSSEAVATRTLQLSTRTLSATAGALLLTRSTRRTAAPAAQPTETTFRRTDRDVSRRASMLDQRSAGWKGLCVRDCVPLNLVREASYPRDVWKMRRRARFSSLGSWTTVATSVQFVDPQVRAIAQSKMTGMEPASVRAGRQR